MKKTILAIAIAMVSTGAMATSPGVGTSQASATIGGGVVIGPGGGAALMTSYTASGATTVSGGTAAACATCGAGAGGAVSGSGALGYTSSAAAGVVTGNASGFNSATSSFSAQTSNQQSASAGGVDVASNSAASVAGVSGAAVNGTGAAISGGVTGAGALAGVGASYSSDNYHTKTTEYYIGIPWVAGVKGGTVSSGSVDKADIALGSGSGAGSLAGSAQVGNAAADVEVMSVASAEASGAADSGVAAVDGSTSTGSMSMAGSDATGSGLAGSGYMSGAAGEMAAYNSVTNEYSWVTTWKFGKDKTSYGPADVTETTSVAGRDIKGGIGGDFAIGNGTATGSTASDILMNGTINGGVPQ